MIRHIPLTMLMAAALLAARAAPAGETAGEKGGPAKMNVNIHVSGDSWDLEGVAAGAGPETKELDIGKAFSLKGLKGWIVRFAVAAPGTLRIDGIEKGPMLASPPRADVMPPPIAGQPGASLRVTLPPEKRIELAIHPAYGPYSVAGWQREWTGERVVFLPCGRYTVGRKGDWQFELVVDEAGAKAGKIVPGAMGRTLAKLAADAFKVAVGPPNATKVTLALPEDAGSYAIDGVLPPGTGNRVAWLPPGDYKLRGRPEGLLEWSISFTVKPDGLANVPREIAGGMLEARGATLLWTEPAHGAPAPAEAQLFAFVQLGRQAFRQGEQIRLSVVLKQPQPSEGRLEIVAAPVDAGNIDPVRILARNWDVAGMHATQSFDVDASCVAPGTYDIQARFAKLQSAPARVIVTRGHETRATHFAICSYTHIDPAFGEKLLFNVDQPNHYGPHILSPRVTSDSRKRYAAAWKDPLGKPYETAQDIPANQKFLEELTAHNLDAMLQYGCSHQYFHYGTCFADPQVRAAVGRGSALVTQASRPHNCFRAIVIGDEVGWPRYPDIWLDDSCPWCEQDFQRKAGKPVPRTTDDPDLWRKWMLYKQQELAGFFDEVGRRALAVKRDLGINTQQGNLNFYTIDGGYPPIKNQYLTLLSAHWYPDFHGSLTPALGHEFVRMGKPIPYWPLVWTTRFGWGWMTGREARHDVYLAVSRQTEGIDHFPGFAARETPEFEAIVGPVHRNLTKLGDFLLQLRRDTGNEAALLYSFEEHHADCCQAERVPYRRSLRHVETVALAYFSLLRSHVQASLVSDEDVAGGKLRGRPALLVAGITRMTPKVREMIERYAAAGGKLFADAETTLQIPGAKRIDCRFDGLWRGKKERAVNWPSDDKLYNEKTIAAVEQALGPVVRRPATAGSSLSIVTRLVGGKGEFIWLVNDNVDMNAKDKQGFAAKSLKDTVTLPRAACIYEVLANRKLNGNAEDVELDGGDARLYACLPAEPAAVKVSALVEAAPRPRLAWSAEVVDARGAAIEAPLPVQIDVIDANGKIVCAVYRSTSIDARTGGARPASGRVPLPINAAAGQWTVKAACLIGTASAAAAVNVSPPELKHTVVELGTVVPMSKWDADKAKEMVGKAERLFIVVGTVQQADAPGVQALVEMLRKKLGKESFEVRLASEMRYKEIDRTLGHGMFRKWVDSIGGPRTGVDRPCIFVGTPLDNAFIADVMLDSELTDQLVTPDYPGPGRGAIMYMWKPFSFEHDAVIVTGSDAAGLDAAAQELAATLRD